MGALVWFHVRENGADLGKLTPGRYIVQVVEPGVHTFTAATEATDTLRLDVEADETYFVEGTISMGLVVGHANMRPSTAAAFDKVASRMKLAEPPEVAKAAASPTPAS